MFVRIFAFLSVAAMAVAAVAQSTPSEKINLGERVNSEYEEAQPIISPDGQDLYFIIEDHPLNSYGVNGSQDIWHSRLQPDGQWGRSSRMQRPLNRASANGVYGVSADGNILLIKGAYENGNYRGDGYSFVQRTATGWAAPQRLYIQDYDKMDLGIYSGCAMSSDGRILVMDFCPLRGGTNNKIYVSFLTDSGWTKPKELGGTINRRSEFAPFLASDGRTLYFASERPGGRGDFDIWMSRRQDDSWTNWSEPKNLGPAVNTTGWDSYFSIDASGEYAYMVSRENSIGESDIVKVKLPVEMRPGSVVLLTGTVLNKETRQPVAATINYQILGNDSSQGVAYSDSISGVFKIILPYGGQFAFSAEAEGYFSISQNMDLTNDGGYMEQQRDLLMAPVKVGTDIRLNNIFFDFGKATLRVESHPELRRVKALMTQNPRMVIEIRGHTDDVGSAETNQALSQQRAEAVRDYLRSLGLSDERVSARGLGEEEPVAPNETEEGRQQNRRVEFRILKNS